MLPHPDHNFLFGSLDSKAPSSARKVHIRRLYDILHLSILKHDHGRAKRAWATLSRCTEIDWMSMWATSLHIIGTDTHEDRVSSEKLDFLRALMLQHTEERETILQELVFCLILRGQYKDALSDLQLYLPSFPFQDNPAHHLYAGLISLYLAQPEPDAGSGSFNAILLRDAQSHLEHAKALDPENLVALGFLEKIHELQAQHIAQNDRGSVSDDDEMDAGETGAMTPKRKRPRV